MSQFPDSRDMPSIPRPAVVTAEYLRDILDEYFERTWNRTRGTVAVGAAWRDSPLVVRVPDASADFTVLVDRGSVQSVEMGLPPRPRIVCVMDAAIAQRLYYGETTAAIECVAGRIRVHGHELDRRRLLAAMSYLTW